MTNDFTVPFLSKEELLQPLLYADLFDFPLTAEEIFRFVTIKTDPEQLQQQLDHAVNNQYLALTAGYYSLPHRTGLVAKRQAKTDSAQKLWPQAVHYGRRIAALPFVRMVAVTGSLAVDNPRNGVDDIDYLIVTQPGRLWLCRAMIISLVRWGHRQGVHLCPNYIITENVLYFDQQDLFTAREVVQMVPLYGGSCYQDIRAINKWVTDYLPQGDWQNLTRLQDRLGPFQKLAKWMGERLLNGFLGNRLEARLQRMQVSKHTQLAAQSDALDQVLFTADVCKGHYDSHGQKTMAAYQERIAQVR